VKLRAVAAGRRPLVVGNGAEGEPGSAKDLQLLTASPHLVLDGLQLAARAVGAADAVLYLQAAALPALHQAMAQRHEAARAGWLRDDVPVRIVQAATGFVSGQETAVVSALNGGPAVPVSAQHRVTLRGVDGRATLVQNVETLAHLALIARYRMSGTFLATVHGSAVEGSAVEGSAVEGVAPVVWEVPHGIPLRSLLETAAGVPVPELQAVLIGGYHGAWLPLPAALDAPLSRQGLAPWGGSLGAGVIMPIAATTCGLELTAGIVRYLAVESAKQCGPCMFGLPHLANLMSGLARGAASSADLAAIRTAVGLVSGRGACHHPDGTARLVRSALVTFERDVVLHGHGRCLATVGAASGGVL
jgi:NADH:ubiquinone oxidoreductase subunit F (NADH-binding)